jgi:hypothetical protein
MKRLLWGAALLLPLLAAADPGWVAEETDLRDGPYADAKTVQTLAADTTVEIRGRQGGWYQVQAGQQQGWVRMSALRLKAPGARAGVLEGGRIGATQSVAATSVRGITDVQLQNASPNMPAVDKLEGGAVSVADARAYAAQGGLQAKTKAAEQGGNE